MLKSFVKTDFSKSTQNGTHGPQPEKQEQFGQRFQLDHVKQSKKICFHTRFDDNHPDLPPFVPAPSSSSLVLAAPAAIGRVFGRDSREVAARVARF